LKVRGMRFGGGELEWGEEEVDASISGGKGTGNRGV
jgi:hypothetical protein